MADTSPSLPDPARIEALAGYGISVAEIASIYRLGPDVIRQSFADELDAGEAKANARVAENLYRKATGDGREAVTAAIFWLKTRARWKEPSVHEVRAARRVTDYTNWTDEMLEAEIRRLDARISLSSGYGRGRQG